MPNTELSVQTPTKRVRKLERVTESDTQALIEAITKASRDPRVDIDKMRFLLDTRRALLKEEAEEEWREAMALAQAEMEPISKDLENPQTRSRYASLSTLDAAIRPIYTRHGFSVTYDTEPWPVEPQTVLVVCYIERRRHSRRYQIPMPCDGMGPKGNAVMTRTHAMGSATSYGRRYLLCLGFNLVTADDDGNRAGTYRERPLPPLPDRGEYVEGPHRGAMEKVGRSIGSLAQEQLEASVAVVTSAELDELTSLMERAGDKDQRELVLKNHYKLPTLKMLTHAQFEAACNRLKIIIGEQNDGE